MTALDNDKTVNVNVLPNGNDGSGSGGDAGGSDAAGFAARARAGPQETPAAQAAPVVVEVAPISVAASPPPAADVESRLNPRPLRPPRVEPVRVPDPSTDTHLQSWTIPLASIDAAGSPFRFRRKLSGRCGDSLARRVDRLGGPAPSLVVRKVGDAFQLVSGFRRHTALSFLARTKVMIRRRFP